MTPTKADLQNMIRDDAATLAARIFAALPAGDRDCADAFTEWREIQRRIFDNPEVSPHDLYLQEQEAFETLKASMELAGVKTI